MKRILAGLGVAVVLVAVSSPAFAADPKHPEHPGHPPKPVQPVDTDTKPPGLNNVYGELHAVATPPVPAEETHLS